MSAREFCYQIEREWYQARIVLLIALVSLLALTGCDNANGDPASQEAPPAAKVIVTEDASLFTVDHPEQFPLATADARSSASALVVTGAVAPDVSRSVAVVSLASGRVMPIKARLGDTVEKGQLLLTVRSDDIAGGFSDYRKAVADEVLARAQLEHAKDLYEHGAIALNDFQVAQDTEDKAKVDVKTTAEHLRLIGNDPDKPAHMVNIFAPISGVITDQQITNASGVQAFGSPAPFTISDISEVWVICDVYDWSTVGQIYWYTIRSTNPRYDLMELRSLEDFVLLKQFKSVPNVVDVSDFGGAVREYQVRVDPNKLVSYGLSVGQIEQQLANNNINAGGSFVEVGMQQMNVRALGLFTNVNDIEQTILKTQTGDPAPNQRYR